MTWRSLLLGAALGVGSAGAQLEPAPAQTPPIRNVSFDDDRRAAGTAYFGASFRHTFGGRLFDFTRAGFYGTLGTTALLGPVGARVVAGYIPSNNTLDANADLTLGLGPTNGFEPYLALGAGVLLSGSFDNPRVRATDLYANSVVGVDYRFSNDVSLYTELNPRYYFSNLGAGTGLQQGRPGGFVFGHKTGLRIYF